MLVALLTVVFISGCGSPTSEENDDSENKGKIVVGGKDYTEQHILLDITTLYLEDNGYEVEQVSDLGSSIAHKAYVNGEIDLFWEQMATLLLVQLEQEPTQDVDEAYEIVKKLDKEQNNSIVLPYAELNNGYVMMMNKEKADELGINSISDLANYVNENPKELELGSSVEFYAREDGIEGMEEKYGFEFPAGNVTKVESGILYDALRDEDVSVSVGFATDSRIKEYDFTILEDDQSFFTPYNSIPLIREEVLNKYPEIEDLINNLSERLTSEVSRENNYKVDIDHEDIEEVAREWLESEDLIK